MCREWSCLLRSKWFHLKSSDGKVFTTATELEYTEPIVLDKFTTAKTPAMPGDEVKLQGDYMNLVMSVTFEGGAVAQVKHIDRHNASVIIPSSAITGKIVLSDEGEIANLIYSENEIQIGDPTVSSVKASAWKPNNEATISGTYLDMIKEVQLEGFITIESEGLSAPDEDYHREVSAEIAHHLCQLIGLEKEKSVLVVGLGNQGITADSLGPEVIQKLQMKQNQKLRE